MVTLLSKFRIEYSTITLVSDIGKAPEYGKYVNYEIS